MASGKEIRGQISSVENTRKITKAMEMVAASKMRKAQTGCAPVVHIAKLFAILQLTWQKQTLITFIHLPLNVRKPKESVWLSLRLTRVCVVA